VKAEISPTQYIEAKDGKRQTALALALALIHSTINSPIHRIRYSDFFGIVSVTGVLSGAGIYFLGV
jgi:hypothetical protein